MMIDDHIKVKPESLPNLDGVRAYACLLVVISHLPHGQDVLGSIGVGVFFTLSGFLMSYLYVHTHFSVSSLLKFSISRATRIFPIYWLSLTICMILYGISGDPDFPMQLDSATQVLRHFAFIGSRSVFWSIPPEIQFYIFFPFIWFTLSNFKKAPSNALFMMFLTCVLILTRSHWGGILLPNKMHFFICGCLAGCIVRPNWITTKDRFNVTILQALSLFIIILPVFIFKNKKDFYDSLDWSILYGLAVYTLSFSTSFSRFILGNKIVRRIGHASFSIYLFHVLIIYYAAKIFNIDVTIYNYSWLYLLVPAVFIPMLISISIEFPIQHYTRNLLEKISFRSLTK